MANVLPNAWQAVQQVHSEHVANAWRTRGKRVANVLPNTGNARQTWGNRVANTPLACRAPPSSSAMEPWRVCEVVVCLLAMMWNNYVYFDDGSALLGANARIEYDLLCSVLGLCFLTFHLHRDAAPGASAAAGVFAFYGFLDSGGAIIPIVMGGWRARPDAWDPRDGHAFPDAPFNHFYALFASTRILAALYIDEMGITLAAVFTCVWAFLARLINVKDNTALVDEVPCLTVTVPYLILLARRRQRERMHMLPQTRPADLI